MHAALTILNICRRGRRLLSLTAVAALGVPLGGCDALDNMLDVTPQDRIIADNLEVPSQARLLVNSVITELECALSRYVLMNGVVGDELADGSTTPMHTAMDRRDLRSGDVSQLWQTTPCSNTIQWGFYTPLVTTRWLGDEVVSRLVGWTDAQVPGRDGLIAEAAAYTGYSKLLLAESLCSVAMAERGELNVTTVFGLAEEDFTRAIAAAQSANNADILNLARVGRARARLNLGRKADAAADARPVPVGYRKDATYGVAPRRENTVHAVVQRLGYFTVSEIYRNLSSQGVPDPRVAVINTGRSTVDGLGSLWVPARYLSEGAPIPLATWEEAQLIVAEAEHEAGNLNAAVTIINLLRDRAGLPQFTGSSATVVLDQIIYERRAEFFLQGHHIGDVRRYALPLTPAAGTTHAKGGTYTDQKCWELPLAEIQNNPYVKR
jgi:starch-binding outer membrane protein, SusD/RagB family